MLIYDDDERRELFLSSETPRIIYRSASAVFTAETNIVHTILIERFTAAGSAASRDAAGRRVEWIFSLRFGSFVNNKKKRQSLL